MGQKNKKTTSKLTKLRTRYPRLVRFGVPAAYSLTLITIAGMTLPVFNALLDGFSLSVFIYTTLGLLTVGALIKALLKKLKSTVLHFWVWGISALTVLVYTAALLLFLAGFAMDMANIHCAGFFGADQSCATANLFWLVILAILPATFPAIWFIGLAILIKGWYDELTLQQ